MLGISRSKCMNNIQIIKHGKGALGLRLCGLGPKMKPMKGLIQLKKLFDEHTFWAKGRSMQSLKKPPDIYLELSRGNKKDHNQATQPVK